MAIEKMMVADDVAGTNMSASKSQGMERLICMAIYPRRPTWIREVGRFDSILLCT
jgi:hypothetical protein